MCIRQICGICASFTTITALLSYAFLLSLAHGDENLLIPSEHIEIDEFVDLHSSYNRYTLDKRNNLTVLAYVTPWNKHGYKVAEEFATKFDLLSPVWFQVWGKKKSYAVAGAHEVDKNWLERIRSTNPALKITPRFNFENWEATDFRETFTDQKNSDSCISKILTAVKNWKFDGAVIEIWSQFYGTPESNLVQFLIQLGRVFRENGLLSILVVPPPVYNNDIPGRFSQDRFQQLAPYMDFFSLMTYDFSPPTRPGPNSPIDWVETCVKLLVPDGRPGQETRRAQILTGFNFYGMEHIVGTHYGEAILGHQFVELVNTTRAKFIWDNNTAEHHIAFHDDKGREHIVYYPTLMSIARRISLINQLGTGMSIWEIGQGLDSFYSQL